jgi:transcriptional regulator with XRE-family HTH domain
MSNKDLASARQLELIGRKIKTARQEVGYSQKELAQVLKLSDKAVSAYEVGRAQPTLQTLVQLSQATHKPISYFLDDAEERDLDFQLRVKKIEQDLVEIKKMLSKKA